MSLAEVGTATTFYTVKEEIMTALYLRLSGLTFSGALLLSSVLVWLSLGGMSLADDLTVTSASPMISFDDTDTFSSLDWAINGDNFAGFTILDLLHGKVPFHLEGGAPAYSLSVNSTGNVGLGTSIPGQKLHLVYGSVTGGIRLEQDTSLGNPARTWNLIGNNSNFLIQDVITDAFVAPFVIAAGAPQFSFVLNQLGRVGIGTDAPGAQLHIAGQATQDVFNGIGPNPASGPAMNFGYSGFSFGRGSGFFNVRPDAAAVAPNPSLRFMTANVQRLIITNLGRVGIGTLAPTQQLDVSGNIRASGSFIAGGTTLNVPDYVFAPEYKLRPLPEVAAYVAKEHHLPDLPSAADLKQGGEVDLGALEMKLLQKVEELTLYSIKQEQTITALEKTVSELKARLTVLEDERVVHPPSPSVRP